MALLGFVFAHPRKRFLPHILLSPTRSPPTPRWQLLDYLMKNCHLQLWACVASRDMTASLKSLAQGRVRVARQPSPLSTQTIDPRPALCGSARANQSQFRTCGMRLCSCRLARAAPWPCGSFSTVRWAWRHTRPPCPSSPAFTWTCRPRARPSLPWRTPRCVCVCVYVCASACGGGCMAALPAVIEPTLLS